MKKEQNDATNDVLVVKGILSKGFGMIPKAIMTDPGIHVVSKSILGYFLSYAGAGMTAFPSRERILKEMHLSENTYDSYMKELKKLGYITVTQTNAGGKGKGFRHNVYTIDMNAQTRETDPEASSAEQEISVSGKFDAFFSGIYRDGYGLAPKTVMTDRELSPTAKAIYLYISAFSGGSDRATPDIEDLTYHLGISSRTYQTHMKMLKDLEYVSVIQNHSSDGRMAGNTFILMDKAPELSASAAELSTDGESHEPGGYNCGTQNPPHGKIYGTQNPPHGKICGTQNLPYGKKPCAQDCGAKINSPENDFSNTDPSVNQFFANKDDGPIDVTTTEETRELSLDEYYLKYRDDIREELAEHKEIPIEWSTDDKKLKAALMLLTGFDCRNTFENCENEEQREKQRHDIATYRLFIEALSDMMKYSAECSTLLNQQVSYPMVFDALKRWYDNRTGYGDFTIPWLFDEIRVGYDSNLHRITNRFAYMKSCIWSALRTGPINTANDRIIRKRL